MSMENLSFGGHGTETSLVWNLVCLVTMVILVRTLQILTWSDSSLKSESSQNKPVLVSFFL